MPVVLDKPATIEDLYAIDGKAELIAGRIVEYMATGARPNAVGVNILVSLHLWCKQHGLGRAFSDNVGFTGEVLASGRRSFSPDVSYKRHPVDVDSMRFVPGAPTFAVEIRSENDYSPSTQMEIIEKRSDYFEAGTEVVWDVDPLALEIRSYHRDSPNEPRIFKPGDEADAEPAVSGWRIAVNEVFEL